MPTFFDSTADAAEASEALRGLAHASRGFEQPAEMYGVIGELSSGMRSLRQALDQIAGVHERKAVLARMPIQTKHKTAMAPCRDNYPWQLLEKSCALRGECRIPEWGISLQAHVLQPAFATREAQSWQVRSQVQSRLSTKSSDAPSTSQRSRR